MGNPKPGPVGRDAVADALVKAAAAEFAERGFEAASIRDIARRAGVNHGLVHRHFGSKAKLLESVIAQLAPQVAGDLQRRPRADAASAPNTSLLLRVLARSLLDGAEIGQQARHPVLEWSIDQASRRTGAAPSDVRVPVAQAVALHLGWLLFEPFLTVAAELTDDEVRAARDGIEPAQRLLIDHWLDGEE